MKKELKEGMGFICETLEDKKRIWQKLTDAGYPMVYSWENALHENYSIMWSTDAHFGSVANHFITDPLNESDFFDEVENWTPKAGEWVEVSTKEDPDNYSKRQYLCTIDGFHLCVEAGGKITEVGQFFIWQHIRQIKPETMTLQEAQDRLKELTGKSVTIKIK
jgi:hypothetical protein